MHELFSLVCKVLRDSGQFPRASFTCTVVKGLVASVLFQYETWSPRQGRESWKVWVGLRVIGQDMTHTFPFPL